MTQDLDAVFEQLDERSSEHSEAEQEKKERRERLGKAAHATHRDARTLLAATGLSYLTFKGVQGLDHGNVDSTLRIAAEVPLYAAGIAAYLTQVMAGLRTAIDVPQTTYDAIRYRIAKRRLEKLDTLDAPAPRAPSVSPSLELG